MAHCDAYAEFIRLLESSIRNHNYTLHSESKSFVTKASFSCCQQNSILADAANHCDEAIGKWTTPVDETVLMGGAPFGFAGLPESLYEKHGVRGVINMCEEYRGPSKEYSRLGIKELWLPTVDHFEPSLKDLNRAVQFIERHKKMGSKVYVHCRAGHGRSAAAVFAWLLSKDPTVDRKALNEELCKLRNVRTTLWRQPNIIRYHSALLSGDEPDDDDDDDYYWTGDEVNEQLDDDNSL